MAEPMVNEQGSKSVIVWFRNLAVPSDEISQFAESLSAAEMEKADRLRLERDRRRYIVGRATLRELIGQKLGLQAHKVFIESGVRGKPFVRDLSLTGTVFNVSHSGELVAVAFSQSCRVGIDIEEIRQEPEYNGILANFFSEAENCYLEKLVEPERSKSFLEIWTAKEAYLKALGEGLYLDPKTVPVAFQPEGKRTLSIDRFDEEWSLFGDICPTGYVGSVAVEQPNAAIETRWIEEPNASL